MGKPFEKITIIGAGTLGAQIALLAANAGYEVTIFDVREGAFDEAFDRFRTATETTGITPIIPLEYLDAAKKLIRPVTDLNESVRDSDLIVESVPENLEIKQNVFREIGKKAPSHTIFTSNSSSIPISRLEESSGRPEKCINTHFYNLVGGMNMADVMGGTKTSQNVFEQGINWVRSMGCIPLTVKKELLGFCFNRVWRAVKREALWMWGNGFVDFRDVDRAWMNFTKMKMGVFGIMDEVGLDVVQAIEMMYYDESGDVKDKPPRALNKMIDQGKLGVKSGEGFYCYPAPEFAGSDFLDPYR